MALTPRGGDCAAVKESHLSQVLNRINFMTDKLANGVGELEEYVKPISLPPPPLGPTGANNLDPARPSLFEEIHNNLDSLDAQITRLKLVTNRIEL